MTPAIPIDVRSQVAIYRQRGWYCVPLRPRSKSPARNDWPNVRIEADDIKTSFSAKDNLGIILGEPSDWLVDVDLDCPEAIELADQYVPPTPSITGRPSAPRSHRWYIAVGATTEKHTDPNDGSMIVELRSTGTQTVVGPSIHPDGEPYDLLDGDPASVPAPMLAACVKALADAVIVKRGVPAPIKLPMQSPRPAANGDIEQRAIAYLNAMPPAISGSSGHSQTFAAATALVHGFGIGPDRALAILQTDYNPRCSPPWSDRELQHKINQAATKSHDRPFGWLRDDGPIEPADDVDLSGFMVAPKVVKAEPPPPKLDECTDPGRLPESMFEVPGFVRKVMNFTLANAPYPNIGLAFCGAMALQSFLAGRKVATTGDLRTNIYLLALAGSGTGKEFPRKVNSQVIFQIGEASGLGDKFASGEGIQDALVRSGRMLFQNDEMDGVLRQINLDRDNSRESIPNILLTLYTSAGDVYPIRVKANQKEALHVDQPHLTLFGTATPQYFYESLSRRMLTNGFFARLNIIDVGKRGKGQTPGSARDIPEHILDVAKWWSDYTPNGGNFMSVHPKPAIVPFTPDAETAITDLRLQTEVEYDKADDAGDEVARAAWSRTCEHAKKLALIYACSESHESPQITLAAVRWASKFSLHQTRRQLYLASVHVAENPFHKECFKFLNKLAEAKNKTVARRDLMRKMKLKSAEFDQVVLTLVQQGEIEPTEIQTSARTTQGYTAVGA